MAKIEGIVPFTVNFTDKSVGDNLTYSWDFGDGGFSEGQSPTYTYNSIGEYKVQLTVTNGYGSNSASNTVMVNKEDTKGDDKEGNGNGKNGKNGGNGKKGGNGKNGGNGKGETETVKVETEMVKAEMEMDIKETETVKAEINNGKVLDYVISKSNSKGWLW